MLVQGIMLAIRLREKFNSIEITDSRGGRLCPPFPPVAAPPADDRGRRARFTSQEPARRLFTCHSPLASLDTGPNPTSWMGRTDFSQTRNGQRSHARRRTRNYPRRTAPVAKTSPVEFINQVKAETAKVVWPTRKETVMTAVMVVIMASLLGIFFLGVDSVFDAIVQYLLSLAN